MQDLLLQLLKAEGTPAEVLLQRLNGAFAAFYQLMTNDSTQTGAEQDCLSTAY